MKKNVKIWAIVVVIAFVSISSIMGNGKKGNKELLEVSFLDVGQGDAILLEMPDGKVALVDAGAGPQILERLTEELPFSERQIDFLVPTHSDKDHIGGFIDVFQKFEVTTILNTVTSSDTNIWKEFLEFAEKEGSTLFPVLVGEVFTFPSGVEIEVLFPDETMIANEETNGFSNVLKITYGNISFLLTGDASVESEGYMLEVLGEENLEATVLKAGHHGSNTSSKREFVEAVNPLYAVISAGQNNSYGHPHPEVIEILENNGAEVLSTAERGTITFKTDGKNLWVD